MERSRGPGTGRSVAGLVVCCVLGWFAFVRDVDVPVLSLVDFGVHEAGHLLTYWLPDLVTAAMGSIAQVAVPWCLGAYFLVARKDVLGGAFCLAWAGTAAQNASVYIADAPWEQLPLTGGYHDWAFVLGPFELDLLHRAGDIARAVETAGLVMVLNAVVLCVAGLVVPRRAALQERASRPSLTPWDGVELGAARR